MNLVDLEPTFLTVDVDTEIMTEVETIEEANGISFLCPKCFRDNNGPIGTHHVLCWAPQVPQTMSPKPGRWAMEGAGVNDLTLKAKSSSIALTGGCQAHFFVTDGVIKIL